MMPTLHSPHPELQDPVEAMLLGISLVPLRGCLTTQQSAEDIGCPSCRSPRRVVPEISMEPWNHILGKGIPCYDPKKVSL
jgi:hypothetical protein